MPKKNLIYLLGSGRSGTTFFATILNSTKQIHTLGELHQFYTHLQEDLKCSCGETLTHCEFWRNRIEQLDIAEDYLQVFEAAQTHEERHRFIPLILSGKQASYNYKKSQEQLFNLLPSNVWLLDSSKYIGRFLLLRQLSFLNVKGVYVVRDVRGVIHSFGKKVQTSRGPINTIIYYLLTNFFAQICYWFYKDVIKIKYEELIDDPEKTLKQVYSLINKNYSENIAEDFNIPHIIGGNRIKSNRIIKIKSDFDWKQKMKRSSQILYFILALPIMVLNRYKI